MFSKCELHLSQPLQEPIFCAINTSVFQVVKLFHVRATDFVDLLCLQNLNNCEHLQDTVRHHMCTYNACTVYIPQCLYLSVYWKSQFGNNLNSTMSYLLLENNV